MKYVLKFIRRFVENPYGLFIRESGQVPVGACAGNPQDISELESRARVSWGTCAMPTTLPSSANQRVRNERMIFTFYPTKAKQKEGYEFSSLCMYCKFAHLLSSVFT